jgi:hypothetical protein
VPDEIKLPGLGPVNKKAFIVASLVGVGVLGYAYYRHRSTSGSAASAASSGTSSAIDPQTGYPTGSPQDLAALQSANGSTSMYSGYGGTDPLTGLPYGSIADQQALQTAGYPVGGGGGSTGTTTTTPTGTTTAATNNATWDAEAISALQNAGYADADISTASAGLGRYLAKLTLTSAQATLVQIAVGLVGQPPVGGPFSIRVAATTPPPPVDTTKVTVPRVIGDRVENANSALYALGLKSTFGARKPNHPYHVVSQSPVAGTKVAKGSTVHLGIKEGI